VSYSTRILSYDAERDLLAIAKFFVAAGDRAVDEQGFRCDLLLDSQRSSVCCSAVYNVYAELLHCTRAEAIISSAGRLAQMPREPPKNHIAT